MAKASMTGFQRIVHLVRPVPVGSRLRVTRYRHFSLLGREMPASPHCPSVAGVEALDGLVAAEDPPHFDLIIEERHDLGPGVVPESDDRPILLSPFLL